MDEAARRRTDGLSYEDSAAIAGRAARGEDVGDVSAVNLVPDDLRGLDRYEARARVVEAITAEGQAVTDAEGAPGVDDRPIIQPFGARSAQEVQPIRHALRFAQVDGLQPVGAEPVGEGEGKFVPQA